MERFQEFEMHGQEKKEEDSGLKTKSGYSPENLFDILVALHAPGNETDPLGLLRRLKRGLVKKTLRAMGAPEQLVSKFSTTPQTRLLLEEVSVLPDEKREEFIEKTCSLEKDRIKEAIVDILRDFNDSNLVGVYLCGSAIRKGKWPHDVDIKVAVKNKNTDSVGALKNELEERLHKRVHIKAVLEEAEAQGEVIQNLITKK